MADWDDISSVVEAPKPAPAPSSWDDISSVVEAPPKTAPAPAPAPFSNQAAGEAMGAMMGGSPLPPASETTPPTAPQEAPPLDASELYKRTPPSDAWQAVTQAPQTIEANWQREQDRLGVPRPEQPQAPINQEIRAAGHNPTQDQQEKEQQEGLQAEANKKLEAMHPITRALVVGAQHGTESLAQPIMRGMALVDPDKYGAGLDEWNKQIRDQSAAVGAMEAKEGGTGVVAGGLRRLTGGLVPALATGGISSAPAAMASVFAADAMSKAASEADDKGVTGGKKVAAVISAGAAATAQAFLFSRMGLAPGGSGIVTKSALQSTLESLPSTALTIGGVNLASAISAKLTGMSDGPIDLPELLKTTAVDTLFMGATHGITHYAQEFAKTNPEQAAKLAEIENPSRNDLLKAGIKEKMSGPDRTELAKQLRLSVGRVDPEGGTQEPMSKEALDKSLDEVPVPEKMALAAAQAAMNEDLGFGKSKGETNVMGTPDKVVKHFDILEKTTGDDKYQEGATLDFRTPSGRFITYVEPSPGETRTESLSEQAPKGLNADALADTQVGIRQPAAAQPSPPTDLSRQPAAAVPPATAGNGAEATPAGTSSELGSGRPTPGAVQPGQPITVQPREGNFAQASDGAANPASQRLAAETPKGVGASIEGAPGKGRILHTADNDAEIGKLQKELLRKNPDFDLQGFRQKIIQQASKLYPHSPLERAAAVSDGMVMMLREGLKEAPQLPAPEVDAKGLSPWNEGYAGQKSRREPMTAQEAEMYLSRKDRMENEAANGAKPAQGRVIEQNALPAPESKPSLSDIGKPDYSLRGDLQGMSPKQVREKLRDDFGVKSTGSKAKDVELYMKHSGEQEMGAMMGAPIGDVAGVGGALKRTFGNAWNVMVGHSLPETTKLSRTAGEALAEHAASSVAAKPIADNLYDKVFGKDAALADKTMAVLTEDNLRGVKDAHAARGDLDKAENVHSLVGEDKQWPNEAAYQKDANSPEVQAAIQRWKEVVNPWMDKQYRTTKGLDKDANLPTRGRQYEARINLLAADHEPGPARPVSGGDNPDNPRRNWNPFRKAASGAAENGYSTSAQAVLENSVNNVYSKATRLRAIRSLVDNGIAKFGEKGVKPPEGQANLTVEMPTSAGLEKKQLYFPKEIESEVRQAMNTDMREEPNGVLKAVNALQMFGITDATAHSLNLVRGIENAPSGKGVLRDLTIGGVPGVRKVDAIARLIGKAVDVKNGTPETRQAIADLARIGALRGSSEHGGPVAKFLQAFDKAGRLVLNDAFDGLVKQGHAVDNDTNRREFVNQVGQYNARFKSKAYNFLKDYGISPFLTAGTTFNRMGAKALLGSHGLAETTSAGADAQLRATQIARNLLVPVALGAAISYAVTGKASPKGVPLGGVDTGKKDEKGNPIYVDLMGVARRGLSVTGAGAAIEGVRQGKSAGDTTDAIGRDVINSNLHPLVGPSVKAGIELAGGRAAVGVPPMPAAPVGGSQLAENAKTALKDSNSILGGAWDAKDAGTNPIAGAAKPAEDALKNLIGIKTGTQPLSPASQLAQEYYRRQIGSKQYSKEEKKAHDTRNQIQADVRAGVPKDAAIKKAVDTGLVTEKEALASAKSGATDRGTTIFKALKIEDATHVLKVATPEEKADWQPLMDKKVGNLVKPLAEKIPLEPNKREEWKANVLTAIDRAQKLGLSKQEVRAAYVKSLVKLKNDDSRQADIQRFNVQLNARWKEQPQLVEK